MSTSETSARAQTSGAAGVSVAIACPVAFRRPLLFVRWLPSLIQSIGLLGTYFWTSFATYYAAVLVVFTGRSPEWMFTWAVGLNRWFLRVGGYLLLQLDDSPLPGARPYPYDPVQLDVAYREEVDRWRPLVAWLLAIPAVAILLVVGAAAVVVGVAAWFSTLLTGSYPRSWFDFMLSVLTFASRTWLYVWWVTPRYPVFSLVTPDRVATWTLDAPAETVVHCRARWDDLTFSGWLVIAPGSVRYEFLGDTFPHWVRATDPPEVIHVRPPLTLRRARLLPLAMGSSMVISGPEGTTTLLPWWVRLPVLLTALREAGIPVEEEWTPFGTGLRLARRRAPRRIFTGSSTRTRSRAGS